MQRRRGAFSRRQDTRVGRRLNKRMMKAQAWRDHDSPQASAVPGFGAQGGGGERAARQQLQNLDTNIGSGGGRGAITASDSYQQRFMAGVTAPGGPMDFRERTGGGGGGGERAARQQLQNPNIGGGGGGGVNVSGLSSQVQEALAPVMAQFQGVSVEHNINHQGLDVTGGDGIGSAIIQQILPQIVGLIKDITTQLINNSSQDATGQIKVRQV